MFRSVKKSLRKFCHAPISSLTLFEFGLYLSFDSLIPLTAFSCSSPGLTSERGPIHILLHASA